MKNKLTGKKRDIARKNIRELAETAKDAQSWREEFCNAVIKTTMELIADEKNLYGEEFADTLRMTLLAKLVATILADVLATMPLSNGPIESRVEAGHEIFKDANEAIMEAVCRGIEGAVKQWSGQLIFFSGEVRADADAVNKTPC